MRGEYPSLRELSFIARMNSILNLRSVSNFSVSILVLNFIFRDYNYEYFVKGVKQKMSSELIIGNHRIPKLSTGVYTQETHNFF